MKVFIAGARAISKLNKDVQERLSNISSNQITVLVGDANGIDKAVQQFFNDTNYRDVLVYAMKGKPRNNIGNWSVEPVEASNNEKGFDYYIIKDVKMAEDADYGFMIWNGKSKGTLNNIINLTNLGKKTLVYLMPEKKFYTILNMDEANNLIKRCGSNILEIANNLKSSPIQITFESIIQNRPTIRS